MNRLYKFVPFARKSRDLHVTTASPITKRAPSGFLVRIGVGTGKPGNRGGGVGVHSYPP